MTQKSTSEIVSLDLLRGMAAFAVLLAHTRGASFVAFGALPQSQQTFPVAVLFGLSRIGQEAVLIFFVLSGFLVGGQILRRVNNGAFDVALYAIDRTTRILLPLVPVCVLTAVLNRLVFSEPIGPWQLFANMTGLNGILAPTLEHNAPLWSLAYEIWFYVLGGSIGYILTRPGSVVALLVCGAGCIVFSVLDSMYLIYWSLGAVATLAIDAKHRHLLFGVASLLILVGTGFIEAAETSRSFTNVVIIPIGAARAMLCVGLALALPYLCSRIVEHILHPLRVFARAISAFSYSLYLTHYPILSLLDTIFQQSSTLSTVSISMFCIRLIVCVIGAILFYLCFEHHTIAARRYLSSLVRQPAAP